MAQDTTLPQGSPGIASFATQSYGGPAEPRFGEGVPTTTTEVVSAGADLNLSIYSVVTVIAGVLSLAPLPGSAQGSASGTLTMANAVPADGDTVTINGQAYTFRATPDDPYEVDIGSDIAATRANLIAAINGDAGAGTAYGEDTPANPYVYATAGSTGVTNFIARDPGDEGNAITLAKVFATGANGTVSGATLSGGSDDPDALPYGILAHPVLMSNGQSMSVAFYRGGHWDMDQLVWAAGWTDAMKAKAFENSRSPNIFISKKKFNNDQIAV